MKLTKVQRAVVKRMRQGERFVYQHLSGLYKLFKGYRAEEVSELTAKALIKKKAIKKKRKTKETSQKNYDEYTLCE